MKHMVYWGAACGAMMGMIACAVHAPGPHDGRFAGTHDVPAPVPAMGRPLAVLLPGASGLKVFDDDHHYFRAAQRCNDLGYDCLLIDYKATYQSMNDRPGGEACEKIAWVVEQVLSDDQHGYAGRGCVLVGWSLGCEGVLRLLSDPARARALSVQAAVLFYPSNECESSIRAGVPVLVLTGDADDVIPVAEVKKTVGNASDQTPALVVYRGAAHGFDIESLAQPRTVRLLPWVGPKATFAYDSVAAKDAWNRIAVFLDQVQHPGSTRRE